MPASQVIQAAALGIGLSACCGFRVFIPLLVAAVAGYFGCIHLNTGMEWLATIPVIICFGTAALFEVSAYYFAFIDNLLDILAAPLAILAGSLIALTILPVEELGPLLKWGLGLLAGGATAGTIQIGSGLLRLLSTKTTAGTGNSVIATGENLAALIGSVTSLFLPILIGILLLGLAISLAFRILSRYNGKQFWKGMDS